MICCVTGHRPQKFPFPHDPKNPQYQRYLEILEREIRSLQDLGYDTFLSGMAYGADLDFGKIVCDVRDCSKEKSVSFEAALPYPIEIEKYRGQNMRLALLERADVVHVVSPCYHGGCMQKRNRFMVDRSDLVLAVWNGERQGGTWNTIQYAKRIQKPVRHILLNEIGKI